jgi:hypothetical protein
MKSWILALGFVFAAGASVAQDTSATTGSATAVSKGQMLVSSNGARLGVVYRVNADGSPQIIIDGKMVTIPAATLSSSNGKLVTSLSRSAVSELR